jgi:ATPase subunit of ABC transporter with duplicated ATPase domains
LLAEAKELGKPSIKNDGTLTYDFMLQLTTLMEKHIVSDAWYHEKEEGHIALRRSKLVDYDKSEAMKSEYDQCNTNMKIFDSYVKSSALSCVMKQIDITAEVWNKTQIAHLTGPKNMQKDLEFKEAIENVRQQHSLKKPEKMTRE